MTNTPSVEGDHQERKAFEAYAKQYPGSYDLTRAKDHLTDELCDWYSDSTTQATWAGWQARAEALPCTGGGAAEDKARLDFLDEANRRLNARYGTTYRWKLIMNHNVNRLMIGHLDVDLEDSQANGLISCREAIDERRRELGWLPAAPSTEPDTGRGLREAAQRLLDPFLHPRDRLVDPYASVTVGDDKRQLTGEVIAAAERLRQALAALSDTTPASEAADHG